MIIFPVYGILNNSDACFMLRPFQVSTTWDLFQYNLDFGFV